MQSAPSRRGGWKPPSPTFHLWLVTSRSFHTRVLEDRSCVRVRGACTHRRSSSGRITFGNGCRCVTSPRVASWHKGEHDIARQTASADVHRHSTSGACSCRGSSARSSSALGVSRPKKLPRLVTVNSPCAEFATRRDVSSARIRAFLGMPWPRRSSVTCDSLNSTEKTLLLNPSIDSLSSDGHHCWWARCYVFRYVAFNSPGVSRARCSSSVALGKNHFCRPLYLIINNR